MLTCNFRISALDPAFPTFYPSIGASALNKKDAKFVDVIHTDAWFYGAPVRTGTADFWPNGGRTLQPGCPRRMYRMLSDNGTIQQIIGNQQCKQMNGLARDD